MAEFAIAAQDYDTGYQRLDIIDVLPDGAVWGTLDLADVASGKMWIVKVPGVGFSIARLAVRELWEPAMPGDPELLSPDPPDRRIKRARRQVKAFVDELPPPKRDELAATGVTTLTLGQAQAIYRKQIWNRGAGVVEDTGIGEFG
jgi:hypothetical protein